MSARKFPLAAAAAVTAALSFSPPAFGFGTVNSSALGQRSEHERITRIGLQCAGGAQAPECFQPSTLDSVAGKNGTWGAVGSADNMPLHLTKDEDYWHCDNADYLSPANNGGKSYPQSRTKALDNLRACYEWGRSMLYDGSGMYGTKFLKQALGVPTWGALREARTLLNPDGSTVASPSGTCDFNGIRGNAKCNVLEPWGYVLHMVEDFYSHTNWADRADPGQRISTSNPPGLGNTDVAPFLDLRRVSSPSDAEVPGDFTGGCFSGVLTNWLVCRNRVAHTEDVNKDKELINTATGGVSDPVSPRSKIVVNGISNGQRAVNGAAAEARRQWSLLRSELVQRYGVQQGAAMACALSMDNTSVCNTRNVVAVVDTSSPAGQSARAAQASDTPAVAAARSLIGELTPNDRLSMLTFDSSTGDQDPDEFVPPAEVKIDDARRGDPEPDPATTDNGAPDAPDPSIVLQADPPGTDETPADQVVPHDHESPESGVRATVAPVTAQAPPAPVKVVDEPVRPASGRKGQAPADALASAAALLENQDGPTGQRGVVMVTNRLGDVKALVARIDELAAAGTSVSLVRFGGGVPDSVVAAIERARGTVLVLPAKADRDADAVADALIGAGLTRLTDPMGADREATLTAGAAPIVGITDDGIDAHLVAPLEDRAELVVRATDDPVRVSVTDAARGTTRTETARPGDPATLALREGGRYEVRIGGESGRVYTASVS